MALCRRDGSDPLLKAMAEQGINMVLPPSEGPRPGALLVVEEDGATRVGDWAAVLGVEPPVSRSGEPSVDAFAFKASNGIEAGMGANIVGRALALFGATPGGISGALAKSGASEVNLQLTAPAATNLTNLDEVLQALRAGKAAPQPGYAKRRFFVVVRSWRARGLSLEFLRSGGGHVEVTTEMVEQMKGQVKLDVKDRVDGRITFLAAEPLVFGVTVRELVEEDGVMIDRAPRETLNFRGDEPSIEHAFITDELFVDLQA